MLTEREMELHKSYRKEGLGSTGGIEALKYYLHGIRCGKEADQCDMAIYTDRGLGIEVHYERTGKNNFKKAMELFKSSAELGNDLAAMNYALYLYDYADKPEEALVWFEKASELGLCLADRQLYIFYREGFCTLPRDIEKAEFYLDRFKARVSSDERQRILASAIEEEKSFIGVRYLYSWMCGGMYRHTYAELPPSEPSLWRRRTHCMQLDTAYYDSVVNGKKHVEMRLYDEKRQKIRLDDHIMFTPVGDQHRGVCVKVRMIRIFPSFEELVKDYDPKALGFPDKTPEEIAEYMNELYKDKRIEGREVVAIEFYEE